MTQACVNCTHLKVTPPPSDPLFRIKAHTVVGNCVALGEPRRSADVWCLNQCPSFKAKQPAPVCAHSRLPFHIPFGIVFYFYGVLSLVLFLLERCHETQ